MDKKWWLVILGCLTHAVNTGFSYFGMSTFFPSFEREFGWSRTAISGAGTALLERAQRAGVVRDDTAFMDVVRMVGAIAMVPTEDPEQKRRLLELALYGLRYQQ